MNDSNSLIANLQNLLQATDPHPVELIQTHISWVLLTRDCVYKIKKPVHFGFVDFSTLEQRRHFCFEELCLNRRVPSTLYLDVVPIAGSSAQPELGGGGTPIEFAVKMRRFDQRWLFGRMIAAGDLQPGHIDQLARTVADLHRVCPVAAADSPWGAKSIVTRYVFDNIDALLALVNDPDMTRTLSALRAWTVQETERLSELFAKRKAAGFVRECHGDLHMGNIVVWDGRVVPFDALEFNEELRWIDVLSEVAFVSMDFSKHGRADLAWRFLNLYLDQTGDYEGVPLLRYYSVYRAVVRALVAALSRAQVIAESEASRKASAEIQDYVRCADELARNAKPKLWITHGLSGSGKTTGTQQWIERNGAIRVRSDVERKRLSAAPQQATDSSRPEMYSTEAVARIYDRLHDLAALMLRSGQSVVVDATFLRRADRQRFRNLAATCGVPFGILAFNAPADELRRRIELRQIAGTDASDANLAVLEKQLIEREPFDAEELAATTSM